MFRRRLLPAVVMTLTGFLQPALGQGLTGFPTLKSYVLSPLQGVAPISPASPAVPLGRGVFTAFNQSVDNRCVTLPIEQGKNYTESNGTNKWEYAMEEADTFEQVIQTQNQMLAASGAYNGVTASASDAASYTFSSTKTTKFLVIRAYLVAKTFAVPSEGVTLTLANNETADDFFARCGNAFVSSYSVGGTYIAIYSFSSSDETTNTENRRSIKAAFQDVAGASASAQSEYSRVVSQSNVNLQVKVPPVIAHDLVLKTLLSQGPVALKTATAKFYDEVVSDPTKGVIVSQNTRFYQSQFRQTLRSFAPVLSANVASQEEAANEHDRREQRIAVLRTVQNALAVFRNTEKARLVLASYQPVDEMKLAAEISSLTPRLKPTSLLLCAQGDVSECPKYMSGSSQYSPYVAPLLYSLDARRPDYYLLSDVSTAFQMTGYWCQNSNCSSRVDAASPLTSLLFRKRGSLDHWVLLCGISGAATLVPQSADVYFFAIASQRQTFFRDQDFRTNLSLRAFHTLYKEDASYPAGFDIKLWAGPAAYKSKIGCGSGAILDPDTNVVH